VRSEFFIERSLFHIGETIRHLESTGAAGAYRGVPAAAASSAPAAVDGRADGVKTGFS
jgi:hypothetical protein